MIKAEDLINIFNQMFEERWGYIPNTSGEKWTQREQDTATDEVVRKYGQQWVGHMVADCSGAFVYAYRQFGQKIYHGSNRIARKYVEELLPISQARPGMAAFKIRKPGDKYYDLPSEYKGTSDLNDYYHIGVVDTDGKHVINAQSTQTGVVKSNLDDWGCVAKLKAVEYQDGTEKEDQLMIYEQATVVLAAGNKGSTVNMREGPGTDYVIEKRVPVGQTVDILYDQGKWCEILYQGKRGWMQSNYLEYIGQADETDQGGFTNDQQRKIADLTDAIDEYSNKILQATKAICEIVGMG